MAGVNFDMIDDVQANSCLSGLASQGIEFLLCHQGKIPLSSMDKMKKICLFFSANWCRPCKVFTPQLVEIYNTLNRSGKEVEIIFISLDRDVKNFLEHFNSMPWLAVPFDSKVVDQLCYYFSVNKLPSLIPLASDGKNTQEDAVSLVEDYGIEAFPFDKERREHLKAVDDAKRQWGTLEDLVATAERDCHCF